MKELHEIYIRRCLELAMKSNGLEAPNPKVGAVVVKDNKIIGEGYHQVFGEAHAEINAMNVVDDKSLLENGTLYVSLEPCCHHGKTPPCTEAIISHKIQKVVIGSNDPNPLVEGSGARMLKEKGLEVVEGVLEKECIELNKRFYCFHQNKRPYIILKEAKTKDGFVAPSSQISGDPLKISSKETNALVHSWRSQEQAILVGMKTILADNPILNVRHVKGKNPRVFIFGKKKDANPGLKILDRDPIFFESDEPVQEMITYCIRNEVLSVLVEGGPKTHQKFLKVGLWDEARLITGKIKIEEGVKAVDIPIYKTDEFELGSDTIEIGKNTVIHD